MRDATILVLISLFFGGCTPAEITPQDAAETAAGAFLISIDKGNYQESWLDASILMRAKVAQEDWADHVSSTRQPLGVRKHRATDSIELLDSLEEMPDGKYALVAFTSTFSDNREATEVVGLVLDSESTWRVIGYYLP